MRNASVVGVGGARKCSEAHTSLPPAASSDCLLLRTLNTAESLSLHDWWNASLLVVVVFRAGRVFGTSRTTPHVFAVHIHPQPSQAFMSIDIQGACFAGILFFLILNLGCEWYQRVQEAHVGEGTCVCISQDGAIVASGGADQVCKFAIVT